VTNTGKTTITGDLGVSPGTAVTGFPPGKVSGTIHKGDAVAAQAQTDLTTAYNTLSTLPSTYDYTGDVLGSTGYTTLTPGVYSFGSSAQLTGALTLNFEGESNTCFVFQIGSTLTTASYSSVVVENLGSNDGVFWVVGSSATLGTRTAFEGNILALTSITLTTGATILDGSALARNGAVTLDTNTITPGLNGGSPVPVPSTMFLLGPGLAGLVAFRRRFKN
jgi:type VI secretion system secreted protein VgrG